MITYKFRTDKVTLQGDTHSTSIAYDTILHKIAENSDYVHLGDVGLGFGSSAYAVHNTLSHLDRINKLCIKKNINAYFIRGNHDATYDEIWDSEWSNVFLIKDFAYGIFPNNKKVLFVGGGISVDRCTRCPNIDYWVDEATLTFKGQIEKCDIMFSHDCPEYFNHKTDSLWMRFQWAIDKDPLLVEDCNSQRINIGHIVKDSQITQLFYGHYHNSTVEEFNGIYAKCVNISQLFEFDSTQHYKI